MRNSFFFLFNSPWVALKFDLSPILKIRGFRLLTNFDSRGFPDTPASNVPTCGTSSKFLCFPDSFAKCVLVADSCGKCRWNDRFHLQDNSSQYALKQDNTITNQNKKIVPTILQRNIQLRNFQYCVNNMNRQNMLELQ